MQNFPTRQIHLDFHTSGLIDGVGSDFNANEFAATLKKADIDGICLFSRCHHGWCYYPSKVCKPHPGLKESDLLGKQIAACEAAGIVPMVYTTFCWDELTAHSNPGWVCRDSQGQIMKIDPLTCQHKGTFEPGWNFLCWNSPYREHFLTQAREVLALYDFGYFFIDILFNIEPCCCDYCLTRMKSCGLDPQLPADRLRNSIDSAREFMDYANKAIYEVKPAVKIFYNSRLRTSGVVEDGSIPELKNIGYICIESLPSGPWGYDHFPIYGKYFQNYTSVEKPILGHTGKFQKMWGDFGGLKNQAALDYEVMRMLSHGIASSIGDQLHPNGRLDAATYELIGNTYAKVKSVDKELVASTPVDEIAVMFTNTGGVAKAVGVELDAETGVMKMLMQMQYQFSSIDEYCDLDGYKIVILPDNVMITDNLRSRLNAYIKNGGKLIASFNSGFDANGQWTIDALAIRSSGNNVFTPYYAYPEGEFKDRGVVADTEHVMYLGGRDIELLADDYLVPLKIAEPYFNRRWDHFCSHLQTPPQKRTDKPELVYNNKNVVYFASPVFSCYEQFASAVLKKSFDWAIRQLLDEKLIESDLPTTAEVTYRKLANGGSVLSILHYIHQRRAKNIDIVEDVIPLYNVRISVKTDKPVSKVRELRSGKDISFVVCNGRVEFYLPKIEGFCVVAIDYSKK